MLLWLIGVTQVQFAYLAAIGWPRSSMNGDAQFSVASDQHQPAKARLAECDGI
jgi:hypothetical protein